MPNHDGPEELRAEFLDPHERQAIILQLRVSDLEERLYDAQGKLARVRGELAVAETQREELLNEKENLQVREEQVVRFAESFAARVITRGDENRELHRINRLDSKTGLLKHDAFVRRFEETTGPTQREFDRGRTHSFLLLDLDDFSLYNEAIGHLGTDEACLIPTAGIIDQMIRTDDVAGRFGGEEFEILLPDTDIEGAEKVAEKIRRAINALPIPNKISKDTELPERLGVSITLTSFKQGTGFAEVFNRVDAVLKQKAKKFPGKNQIVVVKD